MSSAVKKERSTPTLILPQSSQANRGSLNKWDAKCKGLAEKSFLFNPYF